MAVIHWLMPILISEISEYIGDAYEECKNRLQRCLASEWAHIEGDYTVVFQFELK